MNLLKKDIKLSNVSRHHIIIYIEVIILTFLLISLFFISPGGKLSFPVVNQGKDASPSEAKKIH